MKLLAYIIYHATLDALFFSQFLLKRTSASRRSRPDLTIKLIKQILTAIFREPVIQLCLLACCIDYIIYTKYIIDEPVIIYFLYVLTLLCIIFWALIKKMMKAFIFILLSHSFAVLLCLCNMQISAAMNLSIVLFVLIFLRLFDSPLIIFNNKIESL